MKPKTLLLATLPVVGFLAASLIPPMQARAQAVAAAAPATGQLDLVMYVGVAMAAAGGLVKILEVLLAGLKWLAPRTKTTVDDKLRDDVQLIHDKLNSLTQLVQGLAPVVKPLLTVVPNESTTTTVVPAAKTGGAQ